MKCGSCGASLVPSIKEITAKLKVNEAEAADLHKYLVEQLRSALAETLPHHMDGAS